MGYISIKSMLQTNEDGPTFVKEVDEIRKYLDTVKNYKGLIIDIRGNGAGNSDYWFKYLIPLIVDKPYSITDYVFTKDSEFINEFNRQSFPKKLSKEKNRFLRLSRIYK